MQPVQLGEEQTVQLGEGQQDAEVERGVHQGDWRSETWVAFVTPYFELR